MPRPKKISTEPEKTRELKVFSIQRKKMQFHILGASPLVYNSVAMHTMGEILIPAEKMTKSEKEITFKHEPLIEYRESTYRRLQSENGQTRLLLPSIMFKAAVADVAKRVPGNATTTALKQLVWVHNPYVDLYGTPKMFMRMVRIPATGSLDIRITAIVPFWYCSVDLTFVVPQLSPDSMSNLMMAAGMLNGVGDYRQQKGAGSYGQFELVNPDDARVTRIKKENMKVQDEALREPEFWDQTTETLMHHFETEAQRRELRPRDRLQLDEEAEA
jgi:hypothetical protein